MIIKSIVIVVFSVILLQAAPIGEMQEPIVNNPVNLQNREFTEYKDFYFLKQQWSPVSIVDTLYTVGPGDLFQININNESFLLTVNAENSLVFPALKVITLKEMRLDKVKAQIVKELKVKYFRDAVLVTLKAPRPMEVMVRGAVSSPGAHLLPAHSRLSQAIAAAKGFSIQSQSRYITIVRGTGDTLVVDYQRYFVEGDKTQNPLLYQNDAVIIEEVNPSHNTVLMQYENRSYYLPIFEDDTLDRVVLRLFRYSHEWAFNTISVTCKDTNEILAVSTLSQHVPDTACAYGLSNQNLEVYVAGAVMHPGALPWRSNETLADYINRAGLHQDSELPGYIEVTHSNGEEGDYDPYTTYARPGDQIVVDLLAINDKEFVDLIFKVLQLGTSGLTLYLILTQ